MRVGRPHRTQPCSATAPLVGRDSELAALAELTLGDVRQRPPVIISGEAGIGKSRLLSALASEAEANGQVTVWGRCASEIETPPYWPWTQVVRQLRNAVGGTDLASVILDDAAVATRAELFEAVVEELRSAARRRPVLVVLEDLHAADAASLLLTRSVSRGIADLPVALVGSYRPGTLLTPEALHQLEEFRSRAVELELAGLDIDSVGALLDRPARAAEVHAVTGGNPLFVEQIRLVELAGNSELGRDVGDRALRNVIRGRLDVLAPMTRNALTAAAVLGDPAPAEAVSALLAEARVSSDGTGPELVPDAVLAAMKDVVSSGLAQIDDAGRLGAIHAIVAEEATASADADTLASFHRRAGARLADDPGRVGEVAYHLLHAGDEHRHHARRACMRAARAAEAAMAYEEAADHLARALAAVDRPGDDAEQLALLLELGRARWRADRRVAADDAFDRAATLARSLGDAESFAHATLRGGIQYYFSGGRAAEQADACREALSLLPSDHPLRSRLTAELAAKLVVGTEADEGRQLSAEALAASRRNGDPLAIGCALVAQQVTDLGPATVARRRESAHEIVALARKTGDHSLAVHGRFLLMGAMLEQGDIRGIDAELAPQPGTLQELADPNLARFTFMFRCTRALLDGRADEAEELAVAGEAMSATFDDPDRIAVLGGQLGVVRWMQGRLHEMEGLFAQQRSQDPSEPLWSAVLAYLWATHGRLDAARGALAEVGDLDGVPDGSHWLLTMVTVAEAAVRVDDQPLVAAAWECLLPYDHHVVPVAMGAAVWGTVARPLGLAALHLGRTEEGLAHLENAVWISGRLGARPWLVEAQLDLVTALVDSGRDDDPRLVPMLEEAAATAEQLALSRFAEQAAELADKVGRGTPKAATPARDRPTVEILGTFQVTAADGRVARWTSRKARELLKILVARRGAPVHREVIMGILWPDTDPKILSNRLSVVLSAVRRALDPDRSSTHDLVAADTTTIRICLDRVDVDVEAFLAAATAALEADRNDTPDATDALLSAARLHQGGPLPDEPYADWSAPLQSTVRSAHLQVVQALADRAFAADDDLTAMDAFNQLVRADPFDPEAHRRLVVVLERLGAASQADRERTRYRALMEAPLTDR